MDDDAGVIDSTGEALAALAARIERLSLDPGAVRAPWIRLAGPLLRAFGYQPRLRTAAAEALLGALQAQAPAGGGAPEGAAAEAGGDPAALAAQVEGAIRELERNVVAAERAFVVHRGLPVAYAAWLERLHELVARAAAAARDPAASTARARRLATGMDAGMVLAPLRLSRTGEAPEDDDGDGAQDRGGSGEEEEDEAPDESAAARRAGLEIAAIDRIIEAARAEGEFLARRRRLLEAARRMLLDAAAKLPLSPRGVEARRRSLAGEIARIDRLEAAGLSASVGLTHQARRALARGDAQRLHAALVALEGAALSTGDAAAAARADAALGLLAGGEDRAGGAAASLRRSAEEVLGAAAAAAIREGFEEARRRLEEKAPALNDGGAPALDRELHALALEYLAPGAEQGAFAALLAVDGCFDVGAALSPIRFEEIELRARAVAHPTPEMILLPARGVADLPSAVIEDPRAIVPALATGSLLARKFVQQEAVRRVRTRLVGEVRIYVLDGSTSMLEGGGARARVRDAILLAELATLARRFEERGAVGRGGGPPAVRVVLFYRYFTKQLGPLVRVADGPGAIAAFGDVLGAARTGGTDIEQALVSSFELIRDEGRRDPDLARAQVVLVTDGNAQVREEVVLQAREEAGGVPVRVSVIALGEENPALRSLVARQRANGERAFYHFVDDAALAEICHGRLDRGAPIHLPDGREPDVAAMKAELGAILDDLAGLGAPRGRGQTEGAEARREALDRDERALEARFARWFPAPAERPGEDAAGASPAPPAQGTPEREALDAARVVLGTVAEVIGEVGGSLAGRRADAIELCLRLLPDAGLSPARYQAALRGHPAELAPALSAIHAAVAPLQQGRGC